MEDDIVWVNGDAAPTPISKSAVTIFSPLSVDHTKFLAYHQFVTVALEHTKCNPAEDYWLSQPVLISAITEMRHYCKTLKFKGETKGMFCTTGKIKLPQLGEPPEPLKLCLPDIMQN
ncbi:hypothetical protein TNCV_3501441 [Trichonephila clavipes]|uniref:Uncharacterized protein n=1 Tax=Trichonephila clavipes TaxID=2585209 RepID=A0A8X6RX34_TRICX|nr:hypothetical protein TNCV_3501441 [Trichonephila clavipes]